MNPNGTRDKAFRIPISDAESVDVKIHVLPLRAQGLDLVPWASTYVLASILHRLDIEAPPPDSPNIPILELGAGIGLVGLIGAMLWHRNVVLTDLEPIVPGLAANIDLNQPLLQQHKGSAAAGTLDWDEPNDLILQDGTSWTADSKKASIIIAADTIYSEDHPPMLAQTILRWLAPGSESRLILTYPLRVAYLDQLRELWELLETGGLESIQEGKEEAAEIPSDSWDDEKLCEWCIWRWKQ